MPRLRLPLGHFLVNGHVVRAPLAEGCDDDAPMAMPRPQLQRPEQYRTLAFSLYETDLRILEAALEILVAYGHAPNRSLVVRIALRQLDLTKLRVALIR